MLVLMVLLKLAAFIVLVDVSLKQGPENSYLMLTTAQSFGGLIALGMFLGVWTDVWPEGDGQSKIEPTNNGKWIFVSYLISIQQCIMMVAVTSRLPLDGTGNTYLAVMILDVLGQMLGVFAGIDYFAAKRNHHFVLEIPYLTSQKSNDE